MGWAVVLAALGAFCSPQPSQPPLRTLGQSITRVSPTRPPALAPFPTPRVHARSARSVRAAVRGGVAATGDSGASPEPAPRGMRKWLLRYRTFLLLAALILQKCVTDILTNYSRKQTAYSATSVALVGEVVKFPLLVVAVIAFGGGAKRVTPVIRGCFTKQPFSLTWVSLCYSVQNVLYFLALSHLSPESYQVLSQSKLLFTAFLMMGMLGTRLRAMQWSALGMLLGGSLLVQLSEASRAVVDGGNAYLGGVWAILGSLLGALPNVYYEKLLKQPGTDEWVRNMQMTFWIFLWIIVSMGFEGKGLKALSFVGFTPIVWTIVALKSLNCLLIPATLKYADNIQYSYAKPTSIVLTCILSSLVSGVSPAPRRLRVACGRASAQRRPPALTRPLCPRALHRLASNTSLPGGHGAGARLHHPLQPQAEGEGGVI